MAQAPQGPTGAPRQNKTVKEFRGMNTQNRRNAIPEGSFAWLENIQPIGPGHLHSIPGRSTAVVRIPPEEPPPAGCTDATERGQQPISIEDRFVQTGTFPSSFGGLRTSWGYISAAEEVYTLIGDAGCDGGNMSYNSTCMQINHFQSPSVLVHPALVDPDGQPTGCVSGTSDVPIYVRKLNQDTHIYDPINLTHVVGTLSAGLVQTSDENFFAKRGDSVYTPCHDTTFPNFFKHVIEYSATTGAVLNDFDFGEQFVIQELAATDDFLYVLGYTVAEGSNFGQIRKLDRTDGSLDGTFRLDDIGAFIMGVVNDDLIYVLTDPPVALYYISNFADLVYVGNTTDSLGAGGQSSGVFINGSLYYGSNGFSGTSTDIFKIPIACPEGSPATPLIASVNRGAGSVVAGATINASWADVLEPDASDRIQLRPAPTGGDLGFDGAALASQVTDGTGTGSIVFTIPGGTTPGTYVFMYAALNTVYVATSPTFTVT